MPRRRKAAGMEFLDEVVDTAVDSFFDRASEFVERVREGQRGTFSEEQLRQSFKCVGCGQSLGVEQMEMLHPSNGFGTCKKCFSFMWSAAKAKVAAFSKRTVRQTAKRVRAAPEPPPGRLPWEVLGVTQDATVEQIKSAYRKLAMTWHPDRVPPGAASAQKDKARQMFEEITRARDVMMSVRKAPED